MGSSTSALANRITVCVTERQRRILFENMRAHGIGMSETLRRILDEWIILKESAIGRREVR